MAHSQNIHLRATFPHLFIRPVVRRLQFHCKTHPHQRSWGNRDEVLKNEVWLWSSLRLRSHGIGRIFLRLHGPTLTYENLDPWPPKFLSEQIENIERFRVNKVSCQIFQPVEIRPIPYERSHDVAQNSLPTRSHSPVCSRCSQADVSPSPWSRQP